MRCNKSSFKREVYSNTILPQETIKTLTTQPNFTPKTTGKRTPPPKKKKKTTKISRRKEIIKIWAEINEKEMKERVVKLNKTKSLFFQKIKQLTNLWPNSSIKKREESNQQN